MTDQEKQELINYRLQRAQETLYDDFVQLQKKDSDILIPQGEELIKCIRMLIGRVNV